MTQTDNADANIPASKLPIPYSVLAAMWAVSLIGCNSLAPQLSLLAWLLGPAVLLAKLVVDADDIAKKKDRPPAIQYKFNYPRVYAAVDETMRRLPGQFITVSVSTPFSNLTPQKGEPLKVDYLVTVRHPDVNRKQLPAAKQNDPTSKIYARVVILPKGNNSEFKIEFDCTALESRLQLDEIIDYIMDNIDELARKG
jgi:hypothetical protein